ncbi:MAG: hypothetical protein CVU44_20890 [Chloroflexi bacterium HGW-Chloroflexi-6]|nr:MAG: hypothetical protein CVU44_20890 [Chloroflexi bacterium HGW-Chloroflexi-6]
MEEKKKQYQYQTVPVDLETHAMIMAMCEHYVMGKRAQGALVKRVIKPEFEKLLEAGLVQSVTPEVKESL